VRLTILALLISCAPETVETPPVAPDTTAYDPNPEVPAVLRDVAMIDDDVAFTHPYVPAHRTSIDGRVALRVQGAPPGTQRIRENLSFFLFQPERLDAPIMAGPTGAQILGDAEPFDIPFPPALDADVTRLGHHAVCDPDPETLGPDDRANPYLCGPDDRHDCYDLVIVSSTSTTGTSAQMWGTPVTVEVSRPKTRDASIVDVRMGEPVAGASVPFMSEFTEPAVSSDGRLLTGRLGRFPRAWTHPETGERFIRPYDLTYAMLPDDAEPCDITGWTVFNPMSHAPYDPQLKGRYGIAEYPFRDSEGQLIPDGEDMGGTYPWVDREANNVFMAGVHGRLVEQSETKFPRRCVHEGCETYRENTDWDRGFLVAGSWTHGKFVHLDGLINNQDWAVGVTPESHWWVDLYTDAAGQPFPIRFGSGRYIDRIRNAGGPYPPGYTHNANIVDSLQQLANHRIEAEPVTPRDVVWIMSNGVASDEVVFDDFMDPNAFIVANMQASVTQNYDEEGQSQAVPIHNNGEVRFFEGSPLVSPYHLDPDAEADIHLQNAATSLGWNVPAYGHIDAGTARIEPVALGGIKGKGLWLSGDAAVRFDVPAQDRAIRAADWYVGLFVDPRGDGARDLMTFPDGSAIRLRGHEAVQYLVDDRLVREVALPETEGWVHLAWVLRGGNTDVTLLVDGMAYDRSQHAVPLFELPPGTFVLGRDETAWGGFRGWVDELRVLAHVPDVEVACNHANGTLVAVDDDPTWSAVADRHPTWAHAEIAAAAATEGPFACFADHSGDFAAHLGNLPAGTRSVRAAIHFPEGPLRHGQPRPDSTDNAFCLSCHTAEGRGGLSLQALALEPGVNAEDDPRRQPSQPPRRVFGNIPADWLPADAGPGSPSTDLQAPPEGYDVDQWLLPADRPAMPPRRPHRH
jgi:hypothetical protein